MGHPVYDVIVFWNCFPIENGRHQSLQRYETANKVIDNKYNLVFHYG
jgi:hypothetical protein